jgi:hypothetical protein
VGHNEQANPLTAAELQLDCVTLLLPLKLGNGRVKRIGKFAVLLAVEFGCEI